MDRLIPLRMAVLGVMLTLVLAVFAAWGTWRGALGTLTGERPVGRFEQTSLAVAQFPALVQQAWTQTMDSLTGREAYKYLSVPRPVSDLSGFTPIPSAPGVPPTGLVMHGDTSQADPGWRLFGGAIMVAGKPTNAVALVSPAFKVTRIWNVNEKGAQLSDAARQERKIIHGMALLPGGSLIVSMDDGSSIQRIDACGNRVWLQPGLYNHVVSYNPDDSSVWSILHGASDVPQTPVNTAAPSTAFVQLDAATGKIRQTITLRQIMDANPDLTVFDIPRFDHNMVRTNASGFHGHWLIDAFHFNDVEPLTEAKAAAFPQFAPGDLLISSRTLNTLFVIDPATLHIKWLRTGATLRQHDPDWGANGTITVFDNRLGRGASQIVSIDPKTDARKVVLDGSTIGFYSRIRGKHMRSARGDLMVASPQQGRAFEIGPDGNLLMDYYDLGPKGEGLNLALTQFTWAPPDTFNQQELSCANP